MTQRIASRLLLSTAILAILGGCTQISDTYNSAYEGIMGSDEKPAKVAVKSPAAAPYQDVKTADINNQPAPAAQPVELGAVHDNSLDGKAQATQSAADAQAPALSPSLTPPANAESQSAAPLAVPPQALNKAPATADEKPVAEKAAAPAASAGGDVALLTVRFNQPHVYYDDALGKAVSEAEKAKPGVVYDVLSNVPDLSSLPADQQTKLAGRAKENLRNVVMKMQRLGVSPDRIRIADQTLKIRSQEIQVYVK